MMRTILHITLFTVAILAGLTVSAKERPPRELFLELPEIPLQQPADLKDDLTELTGLKSRLPGSDGNLALAERVEKRFQSTGFETGKIRFMAPTLSPGKTSIQGKGIGTVEILPMYPSLMRPGNFHEQQFSTRLIYLGTGDAEQILRLKGTPLEGTIALMDYECGDNWLNFLHLGVKGFIFIGSESYFYSDSVKKTFNTEVNVPRFYVNPKTGKSLKDACLKSPVDITVNADPSQWKRTELSNPWVLIPGSDDSLKEELFVITAPLDACSIVPERSFGGLSIMNLDLLLKLLDDFRKAPPKRSVLLVAINAHTQKFLGERLLSWYLIAPPQSVEAIRDGLASEFRKNKMYVENYSMLSLVEPEIKDPDQLTMAVNSLWEIRDLLVERGKLPENPVTGKDNWKFKMVDTTDEDIQLAVKNMVASIDDERSSLQAKLSENKADTEALATSYERAVEFAKLPVGEIRDILSKAMAVFNDEVIFEYWRFYMDESSGLRLLVKDQLQNEVKRRLNLVKQTRMALTYVKKSEQTDGTPDTLNQKMIADLADKQVHLTKLLVLFNKFDIGLGRTRVRYRDIASVPFQRNELIDCRDLLVKRFKSWKVRHQQQLDLDRENSAIKRACGSMRIAIVINLDMDANSDRISFPALNYTSDTNGFRQLALDLSRTVSEPYSDNYNPFRWMPETESLKPDGAVLDKSSAANFFSISKTPSVTLKSARSQYGYRFSPDDTLDNVNLENVAKVQQWLRTFFPALLADPDCTLPKYLKKPNVQTQHLIWSTRMRTFAMDSLSSKPVPDVEVPNTIVTAYAPPHRHRPKPELMVVDGDVLNVFANITDQTGECELYGFDGRSFYSTAYQLDGRSASVTYTIDKGRIQTSKQMTSNLTWHTSKTLPMFPCEEFPVFNLYDPTKIAYSNIGLDELWIKEARSQSEPVKYGLHGIKSVRTTAKTHYSTGPGAFYLWKKNEMYEPDRALIITKDKRFALNSSTDNPRGEGFLTAEELGPDIFVHSVRDMAALNHSRIKEMKGVSNRLAEDFVAQGLQLASNSEKAKAENNHLKWLQTMWMAMGCQAKAQEQVSGMKMDMLKSVVIYMALLLPFCFFLQKLLFTFKRIEQELVVFIVTFISAYILFRTIHPAFRIAQNPEAIFIAFVLAAIGCVVTWVLNSYFSAEMSLLFNKGSFMGAGAVGNTTVGQTAMLLGVQNMRRRRVRTFLTTATIVLIVFTMLSFSSVSKKSKPSLLQKDNQTPYAGLFYHWPKNEAIDNATSHAIQLMFVDSADVYLRRSLSDSTGWPVTFPENDEDKKDLNIRGILATTPDDPVLFQGKPIVAGQFSGDPYAFEIMISSEAADIYEVKPADLPVDVMFKGSQMKVVGIFRDRDIQLAKDLNPNLPLLPLAKAPAIGDESGDEGEEGSLEVDAEDAFGLTVPPTELVLMPVGLAEKLGAGVQNIAVVSKNTDDANSVWKLAERLLKISDAKFFIGFDKAFKMGEEKEAFTFEAGIYYVRNNYRTSIGGLSKLIIPLIIAGSIILNTLLGSVYERKQEIAIYNAIGLNPTHIFLFFLAEALVYSVIGSVGGYLIGQGCALLMKATGILASVNINFSSLMVVYAILFTIALVLISTLYPAFVATRTAVPSGSRKWDLPDHDGTLMQVASPFIYQSKFAPGIMYFLHEFFNECSEASLGDISAQFISVEEQADGKGRPVYQAQYEVAQAPFDVGVTQKVTIRAEYDDLVSSHRMHLFLERLSGQDMAWAATNRPFIARMRKMMLKWRTIDPNRQNWYVKCGTLLFTEGPDANFPKKEDFFEDDSGSGDQPGGDQPETPMTNENDTKEAESE